MTMEWDRHVLTFSAHGYFQQPTDGVSPSEAVRHILDGFADSGSPSMTIYFHGGLVNEQVALTLAEHLYPEISENFESYPVFVIWKSGPLETLQSALLDIHSASPLFLQVLKKLARWVAILLRDQGQPALAAASPGETPLDDVLSAIEAEQLPAAGWESLDALVDEAEFLAGEDPAGALQEALAGDPAASRALGMIVDAKRNSAEAAAAGEPAGGSLPGTTAGTDYLATSIVDRLAEEMAPDLSAGNMGLTTAENWFFVGDILNAILTRFADGTGHGYLGTILEEMYRVMYADKVGRFLWDEMKENAAAAYEPIAEGGMAGGIPGGTLLLQEIKAFMDENGPFKLNLIGHSAGSIHIAHFLEAAVRILPDFFSLANVIFLAPACNFDLFKSKVAPYDAYIGSFRIFTMSDLYERRDPLVKIMPLLYPHSLLYLVSGLFEEKPDTPLIGLARHIEGTSDEEIKTFLGYYDHAEFDPIAFSVTPEGTPLGEQAHFTSHYGLLGPNFDRPTLDSMAIQIRKEPATDLVEFAAVLPKHVAALEPDHRVIMGGRRGILPAGPAANLPPPPGILEQLIGENDIIDHAFIAALMRTGRSVARIVAMGLKDVSKIAPGDRQAAWEEAEKTDHLIQGYGTGWILGSARRVLITNNHVLPLKEAARGATIEFGYERVLNRGTRARYTTRLRPDHLFLTDPNMAFGGLDYTVVALSRPVPEEFGYLEAFQGITANDALNIYIVQHPGGSGKAYVLNHNSKINLPDRYVTYVSDTLEGSSGSPLFNDEGDLVGIHHLGNYEAKIGTKTQTTNLGSRIEFVIQDIAARLHKETAFDEDAVRYWFGDGSVLKAWK